MVMMRRGCCTLSVTLLWLSWLLFFRPFSVHAWYPCPEDRGGGTCPDGATCCATSTPGISSCITEKEDEYVGVCCTDDGTGVTGCDHNYACAARSSTTFNTSTTTTAGARTSNMAATSITSTTHSLSSKDDDDDNDNNDEIDDDDAVTTSNNKTGHNSNIDDTNYIPNQNETRPSESKSQSISSQSNQETQTTTTPQLYCQRIEHPDDPNIPPQLPRYHLCTAPRQELTDLYGLTVKPRAPRLAYYSSLNHLEATDRHTLARHANVRLAWIFIHGSKRNADDYHCCALATLPQHEQDLETSSILVLSPRFLDRSDGPVTIVNPANCSGDDDEETTNTSTTTSSSLTSAECSTEPLYYAKHGPIAHTWRYGADAVNAPISSYKAIDAMVEALAFDTVRFPNLERIIVSGHSAGGQYVHRWALTSMSPAWGDSDDNNNNETNVGADHANGANTAKENGANDHAAQTPNDTPKQRIVPIHAIAANPRSFAYLDQRRFDVTSDNQTVFEIPDQSRIDNCPSYNQWEWGLEPGGRVVAHYKDRAIKKLGGADKLAARYAKRKVTYLAGDLDVLPLWSECEDDDFQGPNRRTRSELFIKSLDEIFGPKGHVHQRVVVPMVHHDHCLLFQSEQGRELLFGKGLEMESQY